MKKKNNKSNDYTWNIEDCSWDLEFSWEEWQEIFERDLEEILKTLGLEKPKESRSSIPTLSSNERH